MVNLSKHPILWESYNVVQAIEECGASEKLTEAVIKASDLSNSIEKLVDDLNKKNSENTKLNLGCDVFKLNGFINIDNNINVNPDMLLDVNFLTNSFAENSVDFIYAGHILEHLPQMNSLELLRQCYSALKPFRSLIVVVPDYTKCKDIIEAERAVLGLGDHKSMYDALRLKMMLKQAGFCVVSEITDLRDIPYLVVPDALNPRPEPWQTAYFALKIA